MSSGKRSIRFKVFSLLMLPLLSLSALWGFVLNLTIGDGLALMRANTIYRGIGVTSTELGLQMQAERAMSATVLSNLGSDRTRLADQRRATDRSLAGFRAAAEAEDTQDAISDATRVSLTSLINDLEQLPGIRANVDSRSDDRLETTQAYNRLMDALFRVYDRMVSVPDLAIFEQAQALQAMGNAREVIARENALVGAAVASGGLSDAEYGAFADWAATRRFLHAKGRAALDFDLRRPYDEVFAGTAFKRFTGIEQDLVDRSRSSGPLPASAAGWQATTDDVTASLDEVGAKTSAVLAERAADVATGIMIRIILAGGLGLVAVVASIIISVRFGRRLARELADLRDSARELAEVRLPRVVERLRAGEDVDVDTDAPPLTDAGGSLEVGDVARAFGSVQRTAVRAAVGQAELRRGVNKVFLNLSRRKQRLLHRQLSLLDAMQRQADDPEALEGLFQLDHLTTRMRRLAESLIILSGAEPGRAWRKPIPVVDVVRAAIAEVEDYTRVTVQPMPDTHLDGTVAADLIHLVAELVENAAVFSPPQTKVLVRGDLVANGFAIEIEDRGLGLAPEEYELINARLARPPEFDLADSERLGLFVVGRLAARNGVGVILRGSPYGGTTAIVLIPKELVAAAAPPAEAPPRHAREEDATALSRRIRGARGAVPARAGGRGRDAVPPLSVVPDRADTGPFPAIPAGPAAPVPGETEAGPATGEAAGSPPAAPPAADSPIADSPAAAPPMAGGRTEEEPHPGSVCPAGHPSRASMVGGTHRGLPRRVRQANLAPQLREGTGPYAAPTPPAPATATPAAPASAAPAPADGPPGPVAERTPDETRAMLSAFQRGARRGRLEAERSRREDSSNAPVRPDPALSSDDADLPPHPDPGTGNERSGRSSSLVTKPRELRDHSHGSVHQTTGEKGDE
ncbi:hypothetical protein Sru01_56250 [Sphaerisporangium rufum]|uniref:histidine kinase n=1 Tax=Sphaerisporangium rufum TaxID=1381558 RepID=A0A919R7F3_9ACTN|nr:nitrate- and nitrite sensing domain-containing protein [Sphaerisporangium rufum]GII80643.1 hypothetical protein Sru01_56250 [Sphaerisporangium rufum]